MIVCEAIGGLNDRLKFLVSCMRLDDDIKLIWTVKSRSVWLWCSFSDLFINNFEEFPNVSECVTKYPDAPFHSGSQFMNVYGDDIILNHLGVDNWGNIVPEKQKASILEQINKLEPVNQIKNVVNKFKSIFNNDTITVSIRSFMDAVRNIASNGKYFDINKVFEKMDNKLYSNKTFFVTCDHQETFEKVLDRYGNRILYTPKRTYFGDYKTVEGIQDCVVDLLLGGQNKHIISTNGSGFCDMQWWFGGGKSTIEIIRAHSHL